MSLWIFLKVFGDICLFFSAMTAFPKAFAHDFSPLTAGLLCAMGAAAACALTQQGKDRQRFWAMLLPLLSLTMAQSVMEGLMLLIPVCYGCVVILRGMMDMEYYTFRGDFRRSACVWVLCFLVLWALSYMENVADPDKRVLAWQEPLMLGCCYLVSGVVLLRRLRLGNGSAGQSAVWTLGKLTGSAVAILVLERVLRLFSGPVRQALQAAATYIIGLPMRMYAWLISLLITGDVEVDPTSVTAPAGEGSSGAMMGGMVSWIQEAAQQLMPPDETERFPWWLVILVLVVVAFAMVWMLRAFRKPEQGALSAEKAETLELEHTNTRQRTQRSNRSRVRKCYRDYLKLERKRGLALKKHHTSLDVLDKLTSGTDPQAARALRELYLIARYDETAEITPEMVWQAKEYLKRCR